MSCSRRACANCGRCVSCVGECSAVGFKREPSAFGQLTTDALEALLGLQGGCDVLGSVGNCGECVAVAGFAECGAGPECVGVG